MGINNRKELIKMTIIFIGTFCWLLFGYIAYLKEARDLHTITFDGLELITCLFLD